MANDVRTSMKMAGLVTDEGVPNATILTRIQYLYPNAMLLKYLLPFSLYLTINSYFHCEFNPQTRGQFRVSQCWIIQQSSLIYCSSRNGRMADSFVPNLQKIVVQGGGKYLSLAHANSITLNVIHEKPHFWFSVEDFNRSGPIMGKPLGIFSIAVASVFLWISFLVVGGESFLKQARRPGCNASVSSGLLPSALYFFGDSTVDTGNNNALPTAIKSNFPPYGQDFITHMPTGRFSNGKTPPDFAASALGIEEALPAYLDPKFKGEKLLKGCSFASGGSGYLDLTSQALNVISLRQQVEFFRQYKAKLGTTFGRQNASSIIENAYFLISAGTNDFIGYFVNPTIQKQRILAQFQNMILQSLGQFIQEIYREGAKRLAVIGYPPFGCLPVAITLFNPLENKCVGRMNRVALYGTSSIRNFLQKTKPIVPGMDLFLVDTYPVMFELSTNPRKYGFTEARRGCCGTGYIELAILCNSRSTVCPDPAQHVWWDAIHPTNAAYQIVSRYVLQAILPQCS